MFTLIRLVIQCEGITIKTFLCLRKWFGYEEQRLCGLHVEMLILFTTTTVTNIFVRVVWWGSEYVANERAIFCWYRTFLEERNYNSLLLSLGFSKVYLMHHDKMHFCSFSRITWSGEWGWRLSWAMTNIRR